MLSEGISEAKGQTTQRKGDSTAISSESQSSDSDTVSRDRFGCLNQGAYTQMQPPGPSHIMEQQTSTSSEQNISIEKFIEVLLQSLNTKQLENKQLRERCAHLELKMRIDSYERKDTPQKTVREPVSRSKSAPETLQVEQFIQANEVRKSSDPQIFLFPDMKHKTAQNKDYGPRSKASDSGTEEDLRNSMGNTSSGSLGRDSNEFLSLKDSFHEPPGVSSQYFNNVINELKKTKIYLHNLQKEKQKCPKCDGANITDKMRNEIQQLRYRNQELQRQLAAKEEEMGQIMTQTVEPEPVVQARDESFELSGESDAELSESFKENTGQGSIEEELQRMTEELQRLRDENEELIKHNQMILQENEELQKSLMKDNHEINRELIQLNEAYDRLKENVKILSTCLQEEKVRSKNNADRLKAKSEETRKLSSQLGSLRQQYEELRLEKNALEKTRSLENTPSLRYTSQYNQTRSSEFHRSGGSNRSGEYSRYGSNRSGQSPASSRINTSESFNIRPETIPSRLGQQNDLSSGDHEPKLSNVPFTGASAPKYECPRCLRSFQVENSYLLHMQSCLE